MQWECDRCGAVHASNPGECHDCGHTVFTQRPDDYPADGGARGGRVTELVLPGDGDGLEFVDVVIVLVLVASVVVGIAALAGVV